MKKLLVLSVVLLGYTNAYAQVSNHAFRLNGTIDVDTGTVVLLPIGNEAYSPNPKNKYQTKIKNGKFSFSGVLAYPSGFLIAQFPKYVSSRFLIEAGTQMIVCHIDSIRETPAITNKSMKEFRTDYTPFFSVISRSKTQLSNAFYRGLDQSPPVAKQTKDSLRAVYLTARSGLVNRQDTLLVAYARQHPNSYVVLWGLVESMDFGYMPIYESIYAALSPALQNTHTGKVLAQRLKSSRATAIGQLFPTLALLDTANKPVRLTTPINSKYTLVDFWFSHCGPCLEQFPVFKELLATYQSRGFAIISISTDTKAAIGSWKKVIHTKDLRWTQYLDIGSKLTTNVLSISAFPANFLLDEKGAIIRKDISPTELQAFLSGKLN